MRKTLPARPPAPTGPCWRIRLSGCNRRRNSPSYPPSIGPRLHPGPGAGVVLVLELSSGPARSSPARRVPMPLRSGPLALCRSSPPGRFRSGPLICCRSAPARRGPALLLSGPLPGPGAVPVLVLAWSSCPARSSPARRGPVLLRSGSPACCRSSFPACILPRKFPAVFPAEYFTRAV